MRKTQMNGIENMTTMFMTEHMKKKLVISFSGGRTSGYMLWWLLNEWQDRHNWEIKIVFANTGLEAPETLLFVHRCEIEWGLDIVWVEARHRDDNGVPFSEMGWAVRHQVVDYFSAARAVQKTDGTWSWTPFEEMISVLGIPSTNAPFCSYQLKKNTIEDYLTSIGWDDYHKAVGIRIDESGRADDKWEKKQIFYPLIHPNPTWRRDVVLWWAKQAFDLDADADLGNCNACWKKDIYRLVRIAKKTPEVFSWWQYITDTYGNLMPREGVDLKPPFNFYRGNISPKEILGFADKYDATQAVMFAEIEKQTGCGESCEAF